VLKPATPVSQDPREWVQRFIGDRGPLQIGSRAASQSSWEPEPREPSAEQAPGAPGKPGPRRTPRATALPRSRSRRGGGLLTATIALLAAAVIVTAVALVIRAGGLARKGAGRADTLATTANAPQPVVKAPSSRASKARARVVPATSPASEAERASEGTAARAKGPWTIDVGGYLDLQYALAERDRMQALTGIQAWVIPAPEGGSEPHRIVVGMYRSRERADRAANMLVSTKTLSEVAVVPLPPPGARR